jgi:hypothetical protein
MVDPWAAVFMALWIAPVLILLFTLIVAACAEEMPVKERNAKEIPRTAKYLLVRFGSFIGFIY